MRSPAICTYCKKVTWTGCGAHAQQVLAAVPGGQAMHLPLSCPPRQPGPASGGMLR